VSMTIAGAARAGSPTKPATVIQGLSIRKRGGKRKAVAGDARTSWVDAWEGKLRRANPPRARELPRQLLRTGGEDGAWHQGSGRARDLGAPPVVSLFSARRITCLFRIGGTKRSDPTRKSAPCLRGRRGARRRGATSPSTDRRPHHHPRGLRPLLPERGVASISRCDGSPCRRMAIRQWRAIENRQLMASRLCERRRRGAGGFPSAVQSRGSIVAWHHSAGFLVVFSCSRFGTLPARARRASLTPARLPDRPPRAPRLDWLPSKDVSSATRIPTTASQ